MKLISLTKFVMQIADEDIPCDRGGMLDKITAYAEFLNQPLKLEMFVPCDEEGNVLEEPKKENYTQKELEETELGYDWHDYEQAKEKVIFEYCLVELKSTLGHYYVVSNVCGNIWISWNDSKKIEDILHRDLTLTPSAIKQLGL